MTKKLKRLVVSNPKFGVPKIARLLPEVLPENSKIGEVYYKNKTN
jgi:hypothetical protein